MKYTPEIAVRIFDGIDGESTILVGQDAHRALLGKELSAMLHRLGFVSRLVANTRVISEVEYITVIRDHPLVKFPDKAIDSTNDGTGNDFFKALVGLEVKPPLDADTIEKIGPFIANLLHDERSDFVLLDGRGEEQEKEIYSKEYSAHIIPFPHN